MIMIDNLCAGPGIGSAMIAQVCIFKADSEYPPNRNRFHRCFEPPYGFEIYSLLTRWNPLNARALSSALQREKMCCCWQACWLHLSHYLNEGWGGGLRLRRTKVDVVTSGAPAQFKT